MTHFLPVFADGCVIVTHLHTLTGASVTDTQISASPGTQAESTSSSNTSILTSEELRSMAIRVIATIGSCLMIAYPPQYLALYW